VWGKFHTYHISWSCSGLIRVLRSGISNAEFPKSYQQSLNKPQGQLGKDGADLGDLKSPKGLGDLTMILQLRPESEDAG
jgi:hypothetical protein